MPVGAGRVPLAVTELCLELVESFERCIAVTSRLCQFPPLPAPQARLELDGSALVADGDVEVGELFMSTSDDRAVEGVLGERSSACLVAGGRAGRGCERGRSVRSFGLEGPDGAGSEHTVICLVLLLQGSHPPGGSVTRERAGEMSGEQVCPVSLRGRARATLDRARRTSSGTAGARSAFAMGCCKACEQLSSTAKRSAGREGAGDVVRVGADVARPLLSAKSRVGSGPLLELLALLAPCLQSSSAPHPSARCSTQRILSTKDVRIRWTSGRAGNATQLSPPAHASLLPSS